MEKLNDSQLADLRETITLHLRRIAALEGELASEQARTNALVTGLRNAPGRLPGYIQEPLDAIIRARTCGMGYTREPCTLDNCGHMRQLDAIVDLLGMHRGSCSVLDFLRTKARDGATPMHFSSSGVPLHPASSCERLCVLDTVTSAPRAALAYCVREVDGEQRVLCVWNRHYGCWGLPGGREEPGDATLEDALLRELEEEIGLGRSVARCEPIFDYPPSDATRCRRVHIFAVNVVGEPRQVEADSPVAWLGRDEFLRSTVFREFYERFFASVDGRSA